MCAIWLVQLSLLDSLGAGFLIDFSQVALQSVSPRVQRENRGRSREAQNVEIIEKVRVALSPIEFP
jgi:hypothetical protein